MSWLSEIQLDNLRRSKGYKIGKNVLISDKAEIVCDHFEIGDNSRIDAFTLITGYVIIGHHTHISAHCTISGGHRIIIGSFVGFSGYIYAFTNNADYSNESLSLPTVPNDVKRKNDYGKIQISSHNIIGAHSVIFPNTHVFRYSKFGAYSVIKGIYDEHKLYISSGNKIAKPVRDLPYHNLENDARKVMNK